MVNLPIPAKGVDRVTGARVQISPAPPFNEIKKKYFVTSFFRCNIYLFLNIIHLVFHLYYNL